MVSQVAYEFDKLQFLDPPDTVNKPMGAPKRQPFKLAGAQGMRKFIPILLPIAPASGPKPLDSRPAGLLQGVRGRDLGVADVLPDLLRSSVALKPMIALHSWDCFSLTLFLKAKEL